MQYKTIVLELLRERTELHEQLRLTRRLLPTLETCAQQLKASHEAWKETLGEGNPGSDPSQIATMAKDAGYVRGCSSVRFLRCAAFCRRASVHRFERDVCSRQSSTPLRSSRLPPCDEGRDRASLHRSLGHLPIVLRSSSRCRGRAKGRGV